MDDIHSASSEKEAQASRPWLLAILSGTVFGGLAAAAANWIALHSQPIVNRSRVNFSRNWATGVAGVASGAIAMYGTLRSAEEPPKTVNNNAPHSTVHTEHAELDEKIRVLSPGERSL